MNTSNENHKLAKTDDLSDRLLDVALAELVGGAAPPDLSSRIAATTSRQPAANVQVPRTRQDRAFLVNLAVAVMLLIGVTVALLPEIRSARDQAHASVAKVDRLGNEEQVRQTQSVDLGSIRSPRPAVPAPGDNKVASAGTAPNADFDHLTDLIKSTVAPDSFSAGDAKMPQFTSDLSVQFSQSAAPIVLAPADVPGFTRAQKSGAETLYKESTKSVEQYHRSLGESDSGISGRALHGSGNSTLRGSNTLGPDAAKASKAEWRFVGERAGLPTTDTLAYHDRRDDVLREIGRPVVVEDGGMIGDDVRAALNTTEGSGSARSGDQYTRIVENPFIKAEGGAAVSTFSIDVDTASYSNVRQFLLEMNQLPPPDAVRIEELVNYFNYDYAPPTGDDAAKTPSAPAGTRDSGSAGGSTAGLYDAPPFAAHVEVAGCPWNAEHRLARIAVKGREMDRNKRPQSNLVFLVDVSGSMNEPAKLPLVKYGLEQLTKELGENDHIAIVVYAGTEGVALPSTSGSKQETILAALRQLEAGGSTAGGAGIQLAYQIAEDNFIKGGTNRVILCTDGDFNVGVTNTADLQRMVEKKAKETGVFISTLGFGRGNLNDAMMVAISDHGNGNYHYIDNRTEARRVLVQEMTGTLVTIAKDVKIQVEFNPAQVAGYRLIGYEKRMLRTEDFNDDKKDAGEIGAGHTVTALYEIVPASKKVEVAPVDDLKYQKPSQGTAAQLARELLDSKAQSDELLTLKMRYKSPDGDTSKKLEWAITDDGKSFAAASGDLKFAASVAGFGLMLRDSQYKGNLTYAATLELAQGGIGDDPHGYRKEFLEMVRKAKELRHE